MDPRIRDHASVVVDHSTSVEPGDNVQIRAPAAAEDLVVAPMEKLPLMAQGREVTASTSSSRRARSSSSRPRRTRRSWRRCWTPTRAPPASANSASA